MNGQDRKYFNKFRSDIFYQLGEISTWMKKHDEFAKERTKSLCKKFDDIYNRLNSLPCGTRTWIPVAVKGLYTWIGTLTIAIVVYLLSR
jgi:hypothetical protein